MGLGKKSITYLVTLGWENPDGVERDMTGQVGWIIFVTLKGMRGIYIILLYWILIGRR